MYKTLHKKQGSVTVQLRFARSSVTFCAKRDNSKWKKVQELMKAKSKLSPETQELFSQALRMLWKTGNQTVKKSVKQAVLEKVEEANSLFSTDKSKKSMKSSKK